MKSLKTTTLAGTIASSNVSVKVQDRNPRRDLLIIQNPSGETGVLFYSFGADAVVGSVNLGLAPGESVRFDEHCGVPGESVHVVAANATHKWVVMVGQRAGIE
jgi:hypothetical protein